MADGDGQPAATAHLEKLAHLCAANPYRGGGARGQSLNHAPRELQDWLGEALHNGSLKILSAPLLDISSSAIRRRAAAGQSIADDVPEAVARLIERWGLYRGVEAA